MKGRVKGQVIAVFEIEVFAATEKFNLFHFICSSLRPLQPKIFSKVTPSAHTSEQHGVCISIKSPSSSQGCRTRLLHTKANLTCEEVLSPLRRPIRCQVSRVDSALACCLRIFFVAGAFLVRRRFSRRICRYRCSTGRSQLQGGWQTGPRLERINRKMLQITDVCKP